AIAPGLQTDAAAMERAAAAGGTAAAGAAAPSPVAAMAPGRKCQEKICGANVRVGCFRDWLATCLHQLLFVLQGKLSEAEPLYKRAQEILEKSLGQDHP
ncbi:unnamed protein product, partial [Ectocarpus sp. 12 AP-2014]